MLTSTKSRAAFLLALVSVCTSAAAVPVIPGMAGFGVDTKAGRGGDIIRVTNLNDSGAGSLRACVTASGPRYCVFEISGTIRLESNLTISSPNVTIAGQTAPSPGILLRGASLTVRASDVLIQHIAVRAGDDPNGPPANSRDSLKITSKSPIKNVVIDHCSLSWSTDEVMETWENWDNVTVSNTILSEPLQDSIHPKGGHGFNVLIGSENPNSKITFFGNLIAHGTNRNPRTNAANFVFVNNVVYNPGDSALVLFNDDGVTSRNTIVGNVFLKGRNTIGKPILLNGSGVYGGASLLDGTKVYLSDNLGWGGTSDPWSLVNNQSGLLMGLFQALSALSLPQGLSAITTSDDKVLDYVLDNAGTRPAQRNSVDARVIGGVRNGTGQIINCVADDGSSRCAKNGGGWPNMAKNVRALTIPPSPNGDGDGDGYTNVEEWLQAMAAEVEGGGAKTPSSTPFPNEPAPPKPPKLDR